MARTSAPAASTRGPSRWRTVIQTIINVVVLAAMAVGLGYYLRTRAGQQGTSTVETPAPAVRLATQTPDTLEMAPETFQAVGVQLAAAKPAPPTAPLKLTGSLFLEGSRLVHVQTRFAGQVVTVGQVAAADGTPPRRLKPGDKVTAGQVLAVLWSKEVGEKKSDLVDALSQYYLHDAVLKRLKGLPQGAVSERALDEAERNYEADIIQVSRVERTLRSWRISEPAIGAIRAEAQRVHQGKQASQPELDRAWAELEITSPIDGVILEQNFTLGDIVETSHDMFKIADLSRLGVMANVYEEDLPKLAALPPDRRQWRIELQAEPDLPPHDGRFETIGSVIDPAQHTAIVSGWLDNPDGQLRVGQFVTATVEIPSREGLVVVPLSSLIDDGNRNFVFIAADPKGLSLSLRQVQVVRRWGTAVLLDSRPKLAAESTGPKPVEVGELVVTSGAVELFGALHNLQTQRPAVAAEAQP